MGILDLLKKRRTDDEDDDEDSQDSVEESEDDEDSGGGGWRGKLGDLRGIGGNVSGRLGKVLKRSGGDDDEEDDDDEVTGGAVAAPAPAVISDSPEESLADLLSAEPAELVEVVAVGTTVTDDVTSSDGEAPDASGDSDIFFVKMEVNLALRDLAMSQDAITAQELADDLGVLLGQLSSIVRVE